MKTLEEKFWDRVDIRGTDECWEWTAGTTTDGYGRIWRIERRGYDGAHRLSYEIHNGNIPDGMEVCHSCDNPPCVNPGHLFLGTHKQNMEDMKNKGRGNKPKGERSGKAKLTNDDSIKIRRMYLTGRYSYKELGANYGVNLTTVYKVLRNKTFVDNWFVPLNRYSMNMSVSDKMKHKIYQLRATGASSRKIAARLGISQPTALKVINGLYGDK